MGWKSTIDITRNEAISAIMSRLLIATDREIADAMESLGFGENRDLPYHGHNFCVVDKIIKDEDDD